MIRLAREQMSPNRSNPPRWNLGRLCLSAALLVAAASAPLRAEESDEVLADPTELGQEDLNTGAARALPEVVGGRFQLPAITASTTALTGRTPDDFRGAGPEPTETLPESGEARDADWNWSVRNWVAANTFSNPRYFEDRMLERHGHVRFGCYQPLASGARFFATVPMLPYLMTVTHPCDCEYTLGYYRSGSCAPALKQRPPWERRAVVAESAAIAGAIIAIP